MRSAIVHVRTLALTLVTLSVTACGGNNFEDFNSWYGKAAYINYTDAEMENARAEVARLRADQQRYADIQTVPTHMTYKQEVQQQNEQPIRYRPDDRSQSWVPSGPLNPAVAARNQAVKEAFTTAQLRAQAQPNLWQRIWPSSN